MPRSAKKTSRPKPVVLIALEGWGVAPAHAGNAISEADPAYFKYLLSHYPALTLEASGPVVGLISGRPVTSEDGYALIGTGRPRPAAKRVVDEHIAAGDFAATPPLATLLSGVRGRRLHLVGLLTPAEGEASLGHLEALVAAATAAGVTDICLHAILDGKYASPTAGKALVEEWEKRLSLVGGRIATLCGRFYALDPYRHPLRVAKAVEAMIAGQGNRAVSAAVAVEENYGKKIFDEEFPPTIIEAADSEATKVREGDSVIFYNVDGRVTRPLAAAFLDRAGALGASLSLFDYGIDGRLPGVFNFPPVAGTLAEAIASAGLRQLRLSDSEGFSGITTFLNCAGEAPLTGEERLIVPTPLLDDYAALPALGNESLSKQAVKAIEDKKYDFIAIAFASIDRLAHSAALEPTIESVRSIDESLERIVTAALAAGGAVVITSTHGLAEQTLTPTGENFSSHTGRIVPLLLVSAELEGFSLGFQQPIDGDLSPVAPAGSLCDVAPTILRLLHLPVPEEMTGRSLYDSKSLV